MKIFEKINRHFFTTLQENKDENDVLGLKKEVGRVGE